MPIEPGRTSVRRPTAPPRRTAPDRDVPAVRPDAEQEPAPAEPAAVDRDGRPGD